MKKLVSSVLAVMLFVSMLTICAFSADIAKTITIEVGTTIELELNLVGIKDYGGLGIHTTGDWDIIRKGMPNGTLLKITGIKEGTCVLKATSSKTGELMSEYTIIIVEDKTPIVTIEVGTTVELELNLAGIKDYGGLEIHTIGEDWNAISKDKPNGTLLKITGIKEGTCVLKATSTKTGATMCEYTVNVAVPKADVKVNFGGSSSDEFYSVTKVEDGYVAVGVSGSLGAGDWTEVDGKGGDDAIIVKYDEIRNVIWKKNFGGKHWDSFSSVTEAEDGYVAVGYSNKDSFGNGDWSGVSGKGKDDAIIVKYDKSGNIIWKSNFGGSEEDRFKSVIATEDGYVAVGYSYFGSLGNGDWSGVSGKGKDDAIIVKYDKSGNVIWKKNFGGSDWDKFYSVTETADGYVAVGRSYDDSFGNGDWANVSGKGDSDAIIVKYDKSGNVIWKSNFGGSDYDIFNSVTATEDGYVAVGESENGSFGNGDWIGISDKNNTDILSDYDGIIVKYDKSGNVIWKKNFGGSSGDCFNSVTATEDGYVVVGHSREGSFCTGDWSEVGGKGGYDAIIVKYDKSGNVIWKSNFGGYYDDYFKSVVVTEYGYVAVGNSWKSSFGTGDWTGISDKGGQYDATLVEYTVSTPSPTSIPPTTTFTSNTATLPKFKVTMNGVTVDNTYLKYPFIVCNDITYFPMTYNNSRLLGVSANYSESTGLVITRFNNTWWWRYESEKRTAPNPETFDVTLATGKITVNGKTINNYTEEYPLLMFRDITYFPMTWRFCVEEFGWSYSFDNVNGLVINTD